MALTDNIVWYWTLNTDLSDSVWWHTWTAIWTLNFSNSWVNAWLWNCVTLDGNEWRTNDSTFEAHMWWALTRAWRVYNASTTYNVQFITAWTWWKLNNIFAMDNSTKMYVYRWNWAGSQSWPVVSNTHTLSATTWYHLAITQTWTTVAFYKNGSALWNASWSVSYTWWVSNQVAITKMFTNGGRFSHVWVWTRALSSTEISQLYNSGNWLAYPFVTTNIKSINWLAYSSIKSINWLAIWSIKNFNWLA